MSNMVPVRRPFAWACVVLSCTAMSSIATGAFAAEPNEAVIEEIFVTGTRVPTLQAVAPVVVLSRRDIERGGPNSLGDVLQALPMNTGSPDNTNVSGGGDGSVRVDLRGLGPKRTLTLLNGRRFPNGGLGADSSVDLNSLPLSMVERVEVLTSGASAVYGSDAVGGVINVVTRRDLRGVDASASRTITARDDGEIIRAQAAAGLDTRGGTWGIGVDYTRQAGVTFDRRLFSAVPKLIINSAGARDNAFQLATPEGRFAVPAGNALGLAPGVYTRAAGAVGQTAADYQSFVRARDGFNTAPFDYMQTPNERTSFWLLGSQPLTGSTNLFFEGLVHRRNSSRRGPPALYLAGSHPTPLLSDGSPGIPADNHYNPFGVDIPCCPFGPPVARRFIEAPEHGATEDVDLWRILIGVEGTVKRWDWELAVGRAESEATAVSTGSVAERRLPPALGASGLDQSGRVVCGAPDPSTGRVPVDGVIADCVPLNLFGGAGSISQEQLDYLFPRPLIDTGTNEQRIADVVLRGPWGRWRGRDLQWVVGADYRREAGSVDTDPLHALRVVPKTSLPGGAYSATAIFAEVQLPLLADVPLSRRVDLNLGVRRSDFSSFGGNTSWQAGLHWQPAESLTVRASYADVFRAPDLFELYEPPGTVEAFGVDPCGNDPSPVQQAHCAASGVPGGVYRQQGEFVAITGGNPGLDAETGQSFGAGISYAPEWAEGLVASVDLYHVELTDFIDLPSPEEVLVECANSGRGDPCSRIHRAPDGNVLEVAMPYQNLARAESRGIDLAVSWRKPLSTGDIVARLLATYLDAAEALSRETDFFGTGELALPRWRGLASVDWRTGPCTASYAIDYIGTYDEIVGPRPVFGVFFEPYPRQVDDVVYHDVELGCAFHSGLSMRAAITNLTDQDPPFLNNRAGNTDVAAYRMLGRTYFLELRYERR